MEIGSGIDCLGRGVVIRSQSGFWQIKRGLVSQWWRIGGISLFLGIGVFWIEGF